MSKKSLIKLPMNRFINLDNAYSFGIVEMQKIVTDKENTLRNFIGGKRKRDLYEKYTVYRFYVNTKCFFETVKDDIEGMAILKEIQEAINNYVSSMEE